MDENSSINFKQLDKKNAFEPSIYAEAEHQVNSKIIIFIRYAF